MKFTSKNRCTWFDNSSRKTVAAEMPAMQCLQLARAEQRRGATLIDGQTVAEKAQKLWQDYLRQRMQP